MNILFILCPKKRSKMVFRFILYLSFVIMTTDALPRCLSGYMTDIQSWVSKYGGLTLANDRHNTLDLAKRPGDIELIVRFELRVFRIVDKKRVNTLSLASNKLRRVPNVFRFTDMHGYSLAQTLEYITFYDNEFSDRKATKSKSCNNEAKKPPFPEIAANFIEEDGVSDWTHGFNGVVFEKLLELDLRSCCIKSINNNSFIGMPTLKSLYLGENQISFIDADAFAGMIGLVHLDISRNFAFDKQKTCNDITFGSKDVLKAPANLESLEFSFTTINSRQFDVLKGLGGHMHKLSICKTGLSDLDDYFFNGTSISYLDISWNTNIFKHNNIFGGLEDTLRVVFADKTGLIDLEPFKKMKKLEILKVANNGINIVSPQCLQNLINLQVLDMQNNQLSTWYEKTFSQLKNLKYLSLKLNDFEIITRDMLEDIAHVMYLGFSTNIVKCNCYSRILLKIAAANEKKGNLKLLEEKNKFNLTVSDRTKFHIGYRTYNNDITTRKKVTLGSDGQDNCDEPIDEINGNFTLVDYDIHNYQCFVTAEGICIPYDNQKTCLLHRGFAYEDYLDKERTRLILLIVIPTIIFIGIGLTYCYRNKVRYFYINFRNSMVLSGLEKNSLIGEDTIFNYDLFVSYCNDDRGWVMEDLITHLETDCNIRVCLHERDFQVGQSILENIVSCMDRSRAIMLIISQKFLLSQWCQFEMHLAQHRLLETRREDLILLLLEEIPKHCRPNTLHYLMLTKTYILWPKDQSEQPAFWKRLKKNIVTQKLKHSESSISLA